ncbi:MAG: VirB3 family type IV secretion system protein [Pseudomonadota bacterium]
MPAPRQSPVHAALLEQPMLGGVESRVAIVNATLAAALVMGFGLWGWVPAAVAVHALAARATRRDPWARQVYAAYLRQADHYDPWPRVGSTRGQRPLGFGRDLLC